MRVLLNIPVVHVKIDLHALIINNFEHRVIFCAYIESTAVRRCARKSTGCASRCACKSTEFASG